MSTSAASCSLSTALQESEFIIQDSAENVEAMVYMNKRRCTAELTITFILKAYNQFFCRVKPHMSKLMITCQSSALELSPCLVMKTYRFTKQGQLEKRHPNMVLFIWSFIYNQNNYKNISFQELKW